MPQLKMIASSTLAALLFATLPAGFALGAEGAPTSGQTKQASASPGATLLKVNGKPITRSELDRSLKILFAQNPQTKQLSPGELKKAEDSVLEQLTNSEILYQAAQEVEIADLEQLVQRQMAENRAKFLSDADYQAALDGMRMTAREMEEFTRRDIAINRLIEKRFAEKAQVTEDEAKKFYQENRARFFEKAQSVRASHILIGTKGTDTPEQRKQAKEKAQALWQRARGGEDFAALARSESSCPSGAKGGDLGRFGKGETVAPLEKAAFALEPGELSEPFETQAGYHILKLTEKVAPRTEPYEEVREKIMEYLKREKVRGELPAYLKELRDKARIEKA